MLITGTLISLDSEIFLALLKIIIVAYYIFVFKYANLNLSMVHIIKTNLYKNNS